MSEDQFLNAARLIGIQSFSSPWLVAVSRLKDPVYPAIYPKINSEKSWWLYCDNIAIILSPTATNKWINTSFNSNNLLINTWNNEQQYTVLPVYKVEFKGLTGALKKISGILGLSFKELLTSPSHRTSGGICLDFGFLRQGFWTHLVISLSNHRQPYPHSLHTQELLSTNPTMVFTMVALTKL